MMDITILSDLLLTGSLAGGTLSGYQTKCQVW
jgi:hypothetical protein